MACGNCIFISCQITKVFDKNPKTSSDTSILLNSRKEVVLDEVILIGDSRVKNVDVIDCGEPIVDLQLEFPELFFDLKRFHVQKEAKSISYARKNIGEKLSLAQSKLPPGLKLVIKECYRPMSVQKGFWDGYTAYLKRKFPTWSDEQVYAECSKLNAPLEVAPHTTGGAVDLTLSDANGNWLDMGTEFNASPLDTENATYTNADNISPAAKLNRKILSDVMSEAGFVNYPTEWWHWSYGDKYWALINKEPHAIYSSTEVRLESASVNLVKKFWGLFSAQKWDEAGKLLYSDFFAIWPQSKEKMNAKNFIEANRNYPGNHKIEVIHAFAIDDKVLTTVWIEADTGQKTFANSIFDIRDDKIVKVEEYWAEPYPAPESRRHWVEIYAANPN